MSTLPSGSRHWEWAVFAPVPVAYMLLFLIHPELGADPFLYLAYAIAFLLLPSIFLSRLTGIRDLGLWERVFLGFPITLSVLFLAVWGGSQIGLGWQGGGILLLLAFLGAMDIVRGRGVPRASEPFALKLTTVLLTISLAICFRFFTQMALPGEKLPVQLLGDDGFMTVMTFSVIKAIQAGTPMMEGMLGDIPFSYHILMHVCNAAAHKITRIHPLFIQVYLYPVFHWFMLAGAVVVGARRLAGFNNVQTILAGILIFYTSGLTFESHAWAQMFGNFHTYFFGLPSTVILCMLIMGYLSNTTNNFSVLYATLLFLSVSSAKGVPLVFIPISLLPVFVYRASTRILTKQDIAFALGCCAVAIVLKIIEYNGTGQIAFRNFNLFNSIIPATLITLDIILFVIVLLVLYNFNAFYSMRIRRIFQYMLFVSTSYFVAIVITRTFDFIGGYQYFFWYFRIFFVIMCAYFLQIAIGSYSKTLKGAAILAVLLPVLVFVPFQYSEYERMKGTHEESALVPSEWQGLMWAYKNIDPNSRIICNGAFGYWTHNGNKVPIGVLDYLAVSGLYGYAWPYSWLPDDARREADTRLRKIHAFFDAKDMTTREHILNDMPIEYVILCKTRDRGSGFLLSARHDVVFENNAMAIYSVSKN